jgi:hypothetical protein
LGPRPHNLAASIYKHFATSNKQKRKSFRYPQKKNQQYGTASGFFIESPLTTSLANLLSKPLDSHRPGQFT